MRKHPIGRRRVIERCDPTAEALVYCPGLVSTVASSSSDYPKVNFHVGDVSPRLQPLPPRERVRVWAPAAVLRIGLVLALGISAVRSDPLDTWNRRQPLPTTEFLYSVSFLNGQFYAFGGSSVFRSTDGTNWLAAWRGGDASLLAAAYGNGRMVAVGGFLAVGDRRGLVSMSTDGRTWTDMISTNLPLLSSIAYGAGTFVAVGSPTASELWTSPDGVQWTNRNILSAGHLLGVAYGSGRFLATGALQDREVYSSTDGLNWSTVLRINDSGISSIVVGSNRFVAHNGGTPLVLTPLPDGGWQIDWATRALTGPVAYGQNGYLAFNASRSIISSSDGLNWGSDIPFPGLGPNEDIAISGLAYGNGVWIGVGGSGLIATSSDGTHWSFPNHATTLSLADICEGNGVLVAVGGLLQQFWTDPTASVIVTSLDGRDWSKQTVPSNRSLASIVHGSGRFVAVGGDPNIAGSGTILVSTNGTDWTATALNQGVPLSKVVYGNGLFTAIGFQGDQPTTIPQGTTVLISSTDGSDWTTRVTATNQFYSGLVYGAGRFVLSDVGTDGWQVLYSSTNLVDWDGPFPKNGGWLLTPGGLSFGNGLFRVAGRAPPWIAGVYLSSDGLHWTFVPTPDQQPASVIPIPGRFLGLLGSTILSSSDGVHWQSRDPGAAVRLNGLVYANQSAFAVGDQGCILQSGLVSPWLEPPRPGSEGGGSWNVTVHSDPGDVLSLETSTNLVDWSGLGTATNVNGAVRLIDRSSADPKQGFYRAKLPSDGR